MTSRQRRIQTLYEISLAIETRDTIEETADQALVAYLQKLNCSVGAVFEATSTAGHEEPALVASIPANPDRNELFRAARKRLTALSEGLSSFSHAGHSSHSDRTADARSLADAPEPAESQSLGDSLPATGAVGDASEYYIFELPDLGALVLGKQGGSLDIETVSALNPLNERLAQACRSNRRERKLREQRDRFEAIFAATSEPTVEVAVENDGTERVQRANDAFKSTFGYAGKPLRGRDLNALITPEDQSVETDALAETLATGEPFRREVERETPAGTGYFLFTAVPVIATDTTEYFGVYVDITDQWEREQTLRELYVAAQDILTESSRQQVCRTVVQTVESVLGYSSVGVHLYDRSSEALEPVATSDRIRERLNGESITYTDRATAVWDTYESGEAIQIDDTRTFDGSLPNEDTPVRSAVIIPVGSHGVIITSAFEANAFDDEDVYFMRVLSQLTAIGLDQQTSEDGLRITQKTARSALQVNSHEKLVEAVLAEIPDALDMPLMGIWKHRPARQRLEPLAVTERSEELFQDPPSFSKGDSLAWQSFETNSTLVTPNASEDPKAYNTETPIKGEIIVPIGDFGVLIAGSTYAESFNGLDAEMLDFLATNLEAIVEVIDNRRDINLLDQVIARILRHNVRNKLTAIMGYTSLIESEAQEPTRGYARRVLKNCKQLEKTSKHAREMRNIVDNRSEVSTVALEEQVRSAASTVRQRFPQGELRIDVQEASTVRAHPELETALRHLVRNGFEHNDTDAPRVDVTVDRSAESARIEIADNGPGIDAYELEVLDEHGESALKHGSGAGLWIVDRVVHYSDAVLEFNTDGGTTAVITFPPSPAP
jgi:PAS domain S-box-containing protein